jgi:hypothetical protein
MRGTVPELGPLPARSNPTNREPAQRTVSSNPCGIWSVPIPGGLTAIDAQVLHAAEQVNAPSNPTAQRPSPALRRTMSPYRAHHLAIDLRGHFGRGVLLDIEGALASSNARSTRRKLAPFGVRRGVSRAAQPAT